ncbi:TldD/PmbA family protein [Thermohalobacter berrensis]|uniref:Peptidase U62 n=1 Tax=Thermohalobacter berrensis TaxID=99594 RepID=A0A419SZD1_9FIRM|nr:TldD/PmbA family protein [Thermohalobacter berrensis]RKD30566.1 peptidase U62 [Thermohalobacter berrensis]
MDIKELVDRLFEYGKKQGFEDMEVYIHGNKKLDIKIFKGEIDKYSLADERGLSFRGIYKGKMGYSYTEKLDKDSIKTLVTDAMDNALNIDSDDEEFIFKGSKNYKEVKSFNKELENISTKEKINFVKELEKEAFALDKRVVAVDYCFYGEETVYSRIVNTKGLDLENNSNIAYSYISVVVKDGDDVKTSGKYIITNDFSKFHVKSLAKEAVDEAISMLGADSIESGEYTTILRNDVAANILEAFVPIFSAENVQKGLSLLKDKIGKEIANSNITIVDDPYMEGGIASSSFDAEGVSTKYKKVIDNGILKTYLHNLKTAKKDGVESTGNGYKGSYKSPISIAPSNMYIKKGQNSFNKIIEDIEKGILIIDVQGLHSGLNPVSGDFSLSAYGYEIEKGKIKRPINQITIAGNFFDMLKEIEVIADDLKFVLPSGNGFIGSPSLKIKKLSISGK